MDEMEVRSLWSGSYSRDGANQALSLFGEFWKPARLVSPASVEGLGQVVELGTVEGERFPVDVVEITLEPSFRLPHNRVTLRGKLKEYFSSHRSSGVLAFFCQPGEARWRLTFAGRQTVAGSVDLVETDAHRFTFVLGPDTGVKTAAKAWLTLVKLPPSSTTWTTAFSQEAVTDKFFERYKGFYNQFVAAMSTDERRRLLGVTDNDKPLRDWVKKLLGRLVFLKFLEKKGWLGAHDYAAHDGDRRFLRHLFELHSGNFYPEALVPLFFETLNRQRPGDTLGISPGGMVPYLNGGLFENDYDVEREEKALTFDGSLFQDLLDFFDEYNFTIDEHDDEAEIGVDPEMLGRIFEQLIEDNEKDMNGTIYTPYPVVEFMVQTSLHLHLCRKRGVDRTSDEGERLRKLIVFQQVEDFTPAEIHLLDAALANLKVLDPAVGSGAFPLGILKEIVRTRAALRVATGGEDTPGLRADLKRHAIKHSLYGVDIDRGAVDIARLRLFLALVVDADLPEPLPNLDFKIMQGDSLAEAWEEIALVFPAAAYRKAHEPDPEDLFGAATHAQSKTAGGRNALEVALSGGENVLDLLDRYVDPTQDPAQKRASRLALEAFERRFVAAVLDEEILARQKPLDDAKVQGNPKKLAKAHEALARAQEYKRDFEALMARKNPEKPYFLWHLYFHDAFEAGGWDIIIGNPPYRANQENENDQAKNREYPLIDARVKETFVAKSTAQKTRVYDLFSRFFRLTFDLVETGKNRPIVNLVSNSAFALSRTYDGFRREVESMFQSAIVIDLKGNARTSGLNRQQQGGNIFNNSVRVGIAVSFLIPTNDRSSGFLVEYAEVDNHTTFEEKVDYVRTLRSESLKPLQIEPDAKANWVNQTDSDWEELVALDAEGDERVFHLMCNGIKTNRDDWVYDFSGETLKAKARYLVDRFETQRVSGKVADDQLDYTIKWSSTLKAALLNDTMLFDQNHIVRSLWRPFGLKWFYKDKIGNDRLTANHFEIWGPKLRSENSVISLPGAPTSLPFHLLTIHTLMDYHGTGDSTLSPLYTYDDSGQKSSNLTPWALDHFRTHYGNPAITDERIFHYVYAVLHNPAYRAKYAQELKQDLPRVPLYDDFEQWADWGAELMTLHADFEDQAEYPGIRAYPGEGNRGNRTHKAEYVPGANGGRAYTGRVIFNDGSILEGIPPRAFDYRLGNKSGIEWILDQYVETFWPTDAEVAAGRKLREDERVLRDRFNTFRFADYKDHVISLIKKVTTISLRTLEVQDEMAQLENHSFDLRSGWTQAFEDALEEPLAAEPGETT